MPPSTNVNHKTSQSNRILWIAGALYAVLYLIFFPPIYSTMDESAYLGMAYALLHHTVYVDMVGISTVFTFPVGAHQVVMYPPGMPAILTLGGLLGWKAIMGLNLLTHLGTFAVVAAILRRLKLPVWYSLLYLLHPTAVIYSRTVMTDISTGLLIGSAFLLYLNRRYFGAGALLGMALLLRSASVVGAPLLCLGCLLDASAFDAATATGSGSTGLAPLRTLDFKDMPTRTMAAIKVGVGYTPFFAFAYYYQAVVQQGGWHKFPLLKPSAFPHGVRTYGLFLLVCYPLMFLGPIFYKRMGKGALNSLIFGFLLLYCCYEFTDTASGKFEAFIVGQRYLLTIMPLLVVAYAGAITDFVVPRMPLLMARRVAAVGGLSILVILTIGVHYKHEQFLRRNVALQQSLLAAVRPTDMLICTGQTGKFFSPGWGAVRTFSSYNADDVPEIHRALADGRGVVYAQWFRERLSDVSIERDPTEQLKQDFDLRPFTSDERHGLPDDVGIYHVEERAGGGGGKFVTGAKGP